MSNRSVFFVSDGTGITAETFGNAILAQFDIVPRRVRLPFIDTIDKADQAIAKINHTAQVEGKRPLVLPPWGTKMCCASFKRAAAVCCLICSAPSLNR